MTLEPVYPQAKFQVTVVQAIKVCQGYIYIPYDMRLKVPSNKDWTHVLGVCGQKKKGYGV